MVAKKKTKKMFFYSCTNLEICYTLYDDIATKNLNIIIKNRF